MRRKSYRMVEIGDSIRSLTAWCADTGVSPKLAYHRIHYLKWPAAQAVGLEPRVVEGYGKTEKIKNQKNVEVVVGGISRTLREWSKVTKIPYTTLVYRYNHWPKGANILEPEPQTPDVRKRRKMLGDPSPADI